MMTMLLLLLVLPGFVSACPDGYNTMFDGQCISNHMYNPSDDPMNAKNMCAALESTLVRLPNSEAQDQFTSYYHDSALLALGCDGEKFVWDDGTVANYTHFAAPETCDATGLSKRYILNNVDDLWHPVVPNQFPYLLCQKITRSWICDTYSLQQQDDTQDICYMYDTKLTLIDKAEANCETQLSHISPIRDKAFNDFLKRTTVGFGITGGVHIGLKHVEDGRYFWSDGTEEKLDGSMYKNFAPGFPDTSFGECVAMGLTVFPGQWMNVECSTPLPYMCTKPANTFDENVKPAGCPDDEDTEFFPGDEIFSPTWGAATGPAACYYVAMDEDKTKKVSVEFVLFESNACCDSLTIYDGLFGDNVLKTLSGYYGITSINVTATSNAMRIMWNATSGAHVRGWHAKVYSV